GRPETHRHRRLLRRLELHRVRPRMEAAYHAPRWPLPHPRLLSRAPAELSLMKIPQTDPKANYLTHAREIDSAIREVLDAGRYILGRQCSGFESEFAGYLGAAHAIGVANGTDALHLALRACEIGPGDAVLT